VNFVAPNLAVMYQVHRPSSTSTSTST